MMERREDWLLRRQRESIRHLLGLDALVSISFFFSYFPCLIDPEYSKCVIEGVAAHRVAKDLHFVARVRRRFELRVGVRSNKLFKSQGRYGDN